jgi:predicted ArsR family transcriptional regulator
LNRASRRSRYNNVTVATLDTPQDPSVTFASLIALCEPARRDLYLFVISRGGWVTRNEAAKALRLGPGMVAHHLDRLAEDGLLEVAYRRLTGRSGPGAGRPAKLYRRADRQFQLTIPPRNPAVVGQLLTEAIHRAGLEAEPVRRQLLEAAREAGVDAGHRGRAGRPTSSPGRAFVDLLSNLGYGPEESGGELMVTNCPYEPLAEQDPELVCSMNRALVEGVMHGVGLRGAACSLRPPTQGECCVRVTPWPAPSDAG